ncbi:MAG: hypothetical protein K2Q12_03190 [Rickettsiales bacterium]|nr:hypothetical protein [Rickettsiales bacterium]
MITNVAYAPRLRNGLLPFTAKLILCMVLGFAVQACSPNSHTGDLAYADQSYVPPARDVQPGDIQQISQGSLIW